MRYELTDYEWAAIKPFLPNKPRGVPRVNDRRVLNGIFWILRSGASWRDLPENFGPYTTCYNRFVRWRRAGVWDRLINALIAGHDVAVQMIDTSIARVYQHGACIAGNSDQLMGRSRGGLMTKIHAIVDTRGPPVRLALTAGEAHDNRLVLTLLSGLKSGAMLLADRGFDAGWIRALVSQHGAWANIPPRRNRTKPICFSRHLYRARSLVERFFNKIKQCRRVATRYDKLAANYPAFIDDFGRTKPKYSMISAWNSSTRTVAAPVCDSAIVTGQNNPNKRQRPRMEKVALLPNREAGINDQCRSPAHLTVKDPSPLAPILLRRTRIHLRP